MKQESLFPQDGPFLWKKALLLVRSDFSDGVAEDGLLRAGGEISTGQGAFVEKLRFHFG